MSSLPNYDAWKLDGPPEGLTCPRCGDEIIGGTFGDEAKCPSECDLPCCFPNRCWCGHPDV